MLQNATPLRKSAPWPPNSSDEHVSCIAPATGNASLQIFFNATKPSRFARFWQGAQSRAPATQNGIWTSKNAPNPSVFPLLTSKCALRHNGVHFFDISTSKSGPDLVCFVHFDFEMCFAPQRRALFGAPNPAVFFFTLYFEMCFAPQRRALFRHLNFQKWSEHVVFLTFWLRNVLRATTACNFSSLICPAGSAPAALASLLFDPPEPQIIVIKHSVSRLSLFTHLVLFSSETFSFLIFFFFSSLPFSSLPFPSLPFSSLLFSSLTLTTSAFHLSILSEVWLLNFLRCLYVSIPMSVYYTYAYTVTRFKHHSMIMLWSYYDHRNIIWSGTGDTAQASGSGKAFSFARCGLLTGG